MASGRCSIASLPWTDSPGITKQPKMIGGPLEELAMHLAVDLVQGRAESQARGLEAAEDDLRILEELFMGRMCARASRSSAESRGRRMASQCSRPNNASARKR